MSVRCPRPECASSRDPDKFKLAIRVTDFASHCWVCGFRARSLMPLLIKHAGREAIESYRTRYAQGQLIDPPCDRERPPLALPSDFRLLAQGSHDSAASRALDYVRSRGITDRDLWRFKLGVSDEPEWRDRVIVPSFDRTGALNFFTGRALRRGMVSYKNCDADKTAIVFNELHVDWTQRVVLCEGPFDLFKAGENAVPLLGSNLTEDSALMDALLLHAAPIALALDDDMQEKAQRLGRELTSYGLDVVMVDFAGRHDPGSMTRHEFADRLACARQWSWAGALRIRLRRATQASLGL